MATIENPFPTYLAGLRATGIESQFDQIPLQQKIILSTLLGISLLLVVASLILRIWKGSFWIARLVAGSSPGEGVSHQSRFIAPNGAIVWLTSSFFFLVAIQFYMWTPSPILGTSVWYILWVGRWFISLSTVSAVLVIPSSHTKRFSLARYPAIVNFTFILVPIVLLAALVPIVILLHIHYTKGLEAYYLLETLLIQANLDFISGNVFAINAPLLESTTARLTQEQLLGYLWITRVWLLWSIASFIELFVFIVASSFHAATMYSSLRQVRNHSTVDGVVNNQRIKSLSSGILSLTLYSFVTILVGTSHFIVSIILAFTPVANVPAASLVVIWFLAIFGGASYVLVFMRSLTAISSKPTTSLTGTRSRLDKSIVPVVVTGGIRVEHFATVGEEFDVVLVPVSSSDLEKSVHLDRAAGQDEWK